MSNDIKLYGIKTKTGKIKQTVSSLMRSVASTDDGEECVEVEIVERGGLVKNFQEGYDAGWRQGYDAGWFDGEAEFSDH